MIMKLIYLLLPIVLFLSCEEEQDPVKNCDDNPLENIDWLKKLVDTENNTDAENSNGLEITQYTYKKQTTFLINNCVNCADNLTILYDCEQNKLCEFGGIAGVNTCPDFEKEATNKTVLFPKPVGFKNCEKGTIISAKLYEITKSTPVTALEIENNCLKITFNILSTQDRIEDVTLVDSGQILESFPAQRRLKFSVKENLTKPTTVEATTSFDISKLAEQGETIILNIDGFKDPIKFTRVPQCGDPNVKCASKQEQERMALKKQFDELQQLSESEPCKDSNNWKFTPVGSKACGGPQLYLPYSVNIDVENFLLKVKTYTKAEADFNKKWGVISNCAVTQAPTSVECVDEKAKLVF